MYSRNLFLLIISQIFGFTAAPVNVFLSGIIGSQLVNIKTFSTLPTTLVIVGTAISSIIAAKVMNKFGRKFGFILASIIATLASLLGAYAIYITSFSFFCISCLLTGFGLAFIAQYRFAAAECVNKENIPNAVSMILIAGIFSALLGPSIASFTKNIINEKLYVGSYLSLACLTILPAILLSFYKNEKRTIESESFHGRKYLEFLKNPKILQAIIAAAFSSAIMSFIMTATPISMYINDNISLNKTAIVIQWHVISMFLPSLFTGYLIKKFGHSQIMFVGIIFFSISILINFIDHTFYHYLFSLIFLGLGWNFLNITGTSLLVISYKKEEKFKAQGFNDFIVFSIQSIASLLAGYFIYLTSWEMMNIFCIPLLVIISIVILRADLKEKIFNL